jgi:type I restriction enzyme, S subunit
MSNKIKTPLVPKLRFPDFRDAANWESRRLGEACHMQAGKFVSAAEIREKNAPGLFPCYGGNGLRGYTSTFTHSGKYSLIGRQGALCGNVKQGIGQFHATEHAIVVTPKSGVKSDWLFFVLDLMNLNRFATGQAQPGLSVDVLEKLPIAVSSDEVEQNKIADCLSSLDELIAAQARKVGALKIHKKGLMQQLFPREGETQPRLRFPAFRDAGDWGVDKLGSVAKNLDNRRVPITSSDREAGDIPYYGASGIVDYVKAFIFDENLLCISEDGANLVARTYPIAFPIAGKTWVNNHAHVLQFENADTQKFVEVYLNSIKLDDFITGMAQPKLNKAMLDSIPIPRPGIPEQQRIADCLTSLDDLITAATRELGTLKTHKKGLMQQLFPCLTDD